MSIKTSFTAAESLYYYLCQLEECNNAFIDVDKKYNPMYEEYTRKMDHKASSELELIIASNCSEYGLLGFKLGMAVAFGLKSELAELFGTMFETRIKEF